MISLVEKIKKDPRHAGMITLLQEENAQRQFSEWAMGFKNLGSEEMAKVPGYSDFLNVPLTSEQFLKNPSQSLRLLLNFKKIMR